MKNSSDSSKPFRKKLVLRLEHIVQLTPLQLKGVQGGSSINDSCDMIGCTKPQ